MVLPDFPGFFLEYNRIWSSKESSCPPSKEISLQIYVLPVMRKIFATGQSGRVSGSFSKEYLSAAYVHIIVDQEKKLISNLGRPFIIVTWRILID